MSECWPNFFIIGAAKSGTTTLYSVLKKHPAIFLPEDKEPRFFSSDNYFRKGIDSYLKNHYQGAEKYKAKGDASPQYLRSYDKAAPRIREAFGSEMKFIVIMRDPVERAWSHYLNQVRLCVENNSFEKALENEAVLSPSQRPSWTDYYGDGLYAKQIKGWLKWFHQNQFLFLLTDDLILDKDGLYRKIYDFLSIDYVNIPSNQTRKNKAGSVKFQWIAKILNNPGKLSGKFKTIFPYELRKQIRDTINVWNKKAFENNLSLDPQTASNLRLRYQTDIDELENFLQRDLSAWKR